MPLPDGLLVEACFLLIKQGYWINRSIFLNAANDLYKAATA